MSASVAGHQDELPTSRGVGDGSQQPLPAGVLVRGTRAELRRVFPALVPLQPVEYARAGLVCAPRADAEVAARALARAPLPIEPLRDLPAWPRVPARMVGGFYVRGEDQVPAPGPLPTIVLAPGEAFGTTDHVATAMALAALPLLPDGRALDVGCGAGLLSLAWGVLGKGPVTGVDVDAGAIAQAEASLAATTPAGQVNFVRREIGQLEPEALAGRVLLANLPAPGHRALLAHPVRPPAVVLAGVRGSEARAIVREWSARGLRALAAARRGRWEAWVLGRGPRRQG